MTRSSVCALILLLFAIPSYAADKKPQISVSLSSKDSRTELGPRRSMRDARTAIVTRDQSVALLLMDDVIAVQLTDRALEDVSAKEDANFVEELIVSTVHAALRRAVEYPITNVRSVTVRDGALVILNDRNEPVFTEVKVNGREALRDFSAADSARFVKAFASVKRARR